MSNKPSDMVGIDELNLDKECIQLPSNYLQAAYASADAKRDVGELKSQLDVVEADLAKEIRLSPERFGLEKVTEGAINATVITHTRYKNAQKRLAEATHAQELAQALVWAMEHKKRALTLLVELHGMGYFSNPKLSRAGKEAVEEMTKRKVRKFRDQDER